MNFQRFAPDAALQRFVECYWAIQSDEKEPHEQKIIPDGFPEIIFHFAAPYQINMHGQWEVQEQSLVAGQLRNYFFLRNTGPSAMLGIKLKPAGIAQLFGFSMKELTDDVVPISSLSSPHLQELEQAVRVESTFEKRVAVAEQQLLQLASANSEQQTIESAVNLMVDAHGCITVQQICTSLFVTERRLQRLFQHYIGLSPKLYGRIIRFSHIFQLLQEEKKSWLHIAHLAGYFDQSHFIRDFKALTGEDPSAYFFDAPNMANFFLKKKERL